MKYALRYKVGSLLRNTDPREHKNMVSQLAPNLPVVLDSDLEWAVKFIEEMETEKAWEWFNLERGLFYERMCSIEAQKIDEIKQEVEKLRVLRRPIPNSYRKLGPRGRPKKGSSPTFIGRGKAWQLGRLERDHKDTFFAAWERGEYKSVKAAAIAARIITVKTPLEQLHSWWRKATPEEKSAFLDKIKEEEEEEEREKLRAS